MTLKIRPLSDLFETQEGFSTLFDWTKHPRYPEVHDVQSYWLDHIKQSPEILKMLRTRRQGEEPQSGDTSKE